MLHEAKTCVCIGVHDNETNVVLLDRVAVWPLYLCQTLLNYLTQPTENLTMTQ